MLKNFVVLIPAYRPDKKLVLLLETLCATPLLKLVVVNDGSGENFRALFGEAEKIKNVEIVQNAVNLGKGRAIKFGINHIMLKYPECEGIITADADGQHHVEDILATARKLLESKKDLILGCRNFDVKTPLKSRLGNTLTTFVFRFLVGLKVRDTQTGLRGFSKRIFPELLRISGEQYEYETNMLLEAKNRGWTLGDVTIQTIYIENNRSSHFNPILDSMKIYFLIFRFFFSSVFSSALDFSFFSIFIKMESTILVAVFGARLLSGWINFFLNRNIVFHANTKISVALIRYWSLVLFMGGLSYSLVLLLNSHFGNIFVLKLLIESVLFLISFSIQKEFVFVKNILTPDKIKEVKK